MSLPTRLTLAGLAVAALAVVAGLVVVPTRLALGAGSIGCGTVLAPDGNGLSAACEPVLADHRRATLAVGAVLAGLALVPLVAGRRFPGSGAKVWAVWGVFLVAVAVAGVAWLATVASVPDSMFFDL